MLKVLRGYLPIEKFAERADRTVGTMRNLSMNGDLPPPDFTIGKRHFYHVDRVRLWIKMRVDRRKLTLAEGRKLGPRTKRE